MIDPSIHEQWLESFRKYYIPLLRAQGFDRLTFTRVLAAGAEAHLTYSLQVEVEDMAGYKQLTEGVLAEYAQTAQSLFGEKLMWFNSLLKKMEL